MIDGEDINKTESEFTQEEYFIAFGVERCQVCGSRRVKRYHRTHSDMEYTVFICSRCKCVLGRQIGKC